MLPLRVHNRGMVGVTATRSGALTANVGLYNRGYIEKTDAAFRAAGIFH